MNQMVEMAESSKSATHDSSWMTHPWNDLTVGNYFLRMPESEAKRIVQIEESDQNPNILVVRFRMGHPPSQMNDISKDALFQRIGRKIC